MTKFSAGTCRLLAITLTSQRGAVRQRGHSLFLFTAPGVGRRRRRYDRLGEILEEAARQLTQRQAEFLRSGPTFWVGRYLTFVNFPISVVVASDSGWAACLNSCKLAPCGTPRLSVRRAYTVNS
jgi:hypothetical protein